MRYRLAIFDFDGTLADSLGWFMGAMNECADRFGFRRVEPHEMETLRGYDTRQIIAHLRAPAWKMPLIARHMRSRMKADIGGIALFAGVDRLLDALTAAGVRIAIVTSNAEENVRRVLGPRNAARVQHFECGASILGKQPRMRKVLRAAGIPAAQAISIGDEIRDLHASRAAGIPFGAVGWGFTTLEALRAQAPDAVFETMDEMITALTAPESARVPT
ncbi:MAG TPA: HAD hydrolase-like protein [Longimicrobium sp.]|nr:HAD hydrolase-like protein [Longimicrobium sp.]